MFAKTYRIFKKVVPTNTTKTIFPEIPEATSKKCSFMIQRGQEAN